MDSCVLTCSLDRVTYNPPSPPPHTHVHTYTHVHRPHHTYIHMQTNTYTQTCIQPPLYPTPATSNYPPVPPPPPLRRHRYVGPFMAQGGSFITLAKGNRSRLVTKACKEHGGFYLGSIGGPAAILAQNCIRKVEVQEYVACL